MAHHCCLAPVKNLMQKLTTWIWLFMIIYSEAPIIIYCVTKAPTTPIQITLIIILRKYYTRWRRASECLLSCLSWRHASTASWYLTYIFVICKIKKDINMMLNPTSMSLKGKINDYISSISQQCCSQSRSGYSSWNNQKYRCIMVKFFKLKWELPITGKWKTTSFLESVRT